MQMVTYVSTILSKYKINLTMEYISASALSRGIKQYNLGKYIKLYHRKHLKIILPELFHVLEAQN